MTQHWIIVGAGSAGCVLANRLSADGSRQITLLEEGPALPAAVPPAISGPNFFEAMATPGRMYDDLIATRAPGIEPSYYQRGRGVGGSSAVNAMVALRGSDALYRSWGWHDLDDAWDQLQLVTSLAQDHEVGAVDLALRADPRARPAQLTRSGGKRVTAAHAYLWPALERSNLTVRTDSAVHRVLLQGRRATGVELVDGSTLLADRVILAAGAIHSPVILLRSQIDTDGIGKGLQDHPSAVLTLQLREGVEQHQSGLPIASTLHATVDDNLLQVLPMSNLGPGSDRARLGALMAALMTPKGRAGSVTIDHDGAPVIDFALLDDERDVHALAAATRLALDLTETPAFREIVQHVFIDDHGTTADELNNDEALIAWLGRNCGDYVHASSSCAMGTVVDQSGSVEGYEGLSVCDASIFPSIPDANTHFPTTMLAERISTLLVS